MEIADGPEDEGISGYLGTRAIKPNGKEETRRLSARYNHMGAHLIHAAAG